MGNEMSTSLESSWALRQHGDLLVSDNHFKNQCETLQGSSVTSES